MNYPLTGYHHITACAGGAQEDVEFFTQSVGLRMAKQTVLMDGKIPIYHLYYSNANLEPGSVMTTFPYSRKPGRRGSGQVQATAFAVPKGSLSFWKDHLKHRKVEQVGIQERFGQSFIRFQHPAGLSFEVLEDSADQREGWTTPDVSKDVAVRGFHGTVLSVREIPRRNDSSSKRWAFGRRAWMVRTTVSRPERGARIKPSRWCASRIARRAVGRLARARCITSRFGAPTTMLSRNRRKFTRNSDIPTHLRSRTASIFIPCIAVARGDSGGKLLQCGGEL